ncbi:hypothetical protein ACE1MS_11685 [Lysinibacillus sp. fkY74-1]
MKRKLQEQLSKLLEIRNIIAVLVTITFLVLSFTGVLQVEFIQSIIMAVIIFFFAKGTTYDEAKKMVDDVKKEDDTDGKV